MRKNLIAIRADDSVKAISDVTYKYLQCYAKQCDADILNLVESGELHTHYRILQLYDLFDHYDRILSLDVDVLILKTCPNIFDTVPRKKVGVVFEDKGSRVADRRNRIKDIQQKFGDILWRSGYINTGCALFSKEHKDIFKYDKDTELYLSLGFDDVYLGYQINSKKIPIHELSYKWNHMSMFSEEWNGSPNIADSYIIHFAGAGRFFDGRSRIENIRETEMVLSKYNMLIGE